jgi:hypothetical protein
MKTVFGIKEVTVAVTEEGMLDVLMQIALPDTRGSLTVTVPRQNYDLRGLQAAALTRAICTLQQYLETAATDTGT